MYGKCISASYFWSITRGGLWWEGSLNGGTTVRSGSINIQSTSRTGLARSGFNPDSLNLD